MKDTILDVAAGEANQVGKMTLVIFQRDVKGENFGFKLATPQECEDLMRFIVESPMANFVTGDEMDCFGGYLPNTCNELLDDCETNPKEMVEVLLIIPSVCERQDVPEKLQVLGGRFRKFKCLEADSYKA